MNENINLCELLRGHEGETFYSPLCGDVILKKIDKNWEPFPIRVSYDARTTNLTKEGRWWNNGECVLFPSKEQRDWNKWSEEQKTEVPKIFDKIPLKEKDYLTRPGNIPFELNKLQKSAIALIKIYQLIEISYGGNITEEEWKIPNYKFCIYCVGNKIEKGEFICQKQHIAFHTSAQRKEFMSYPENVQLVKDFYMI